MIDDRWPCPLDLVEGEDIEIFDSLAGVVVVKVVDVINNVVTVSMGATYMNVICAIDPAYTKWRKMKPTVTYGVRCADPYCPVGFYEHAENIPGWKCRQCKNR